MGPSTSEISVIKAHESLSLTPYWDNKGYSIGYGHFTGIADNGDTSKVAGNLATYGIIMQSDGSITTADAENILQQDIDNVNTDLQNDLKVPLNQTQYDGIFDFVYGVGIGNAKKAVIPYINANNFQAAANEINRWVYEGTVINPNLQRIRSISANNLLNTSAQTQAGFSWLEIGFFALIVGGYFYNKYKKKKKKK